MLVRRSYPCDMRIMDSTQEMAEIIGRHLDFDSIEPCALKRVKLIRSSSLSNSMPVIYEPALCLVAQGRKRVVLGEVAYVYDPSQYVLVTVDLPLLGSILEASEERPFLCVSLDLDLRVLSELLIEHGGSVPPAESRPGLVLGDVTPELTDAMVRLLRLLDTPQDIPALAPLAEREILYRLMSMDQTGMMRHISNSQSRLSQISRAILWIKSNYAEPFTVEQVADEAGMSASSLHQHFKAVTTYSPLQFRTRLRLQEARRAMVAEGLDAASAGFSVGYESPSQFSRDYTKAFGSPPMQDAIRLRSAA
jgi:AraC-like DNA-binding protein